MKTIINAVCIVLLFLSVSAKSETVSDGFINKYILGNHDFTLQWLDNFNTGNHGRITFTRVDGHIVANGYEEEVIGEDLNFMEFNGRVIVVSPHELHITGDLITSISYINGGNGFRRSGTFIFKAHGKRQYWRLQNMREHEVMDYVDIHFK